MSKQIHVVPGKDGNGWDVRSSGAERAIKHTETKSEAVDRARIVSRNQEAELVIHNRNGRIAQKDSHGNDPSNIKG